MVLGEPYGTECGSAEPRVTDVILIATIVVFFLAAAQMVRALGRMVDSGGGADLEYEPEPEPMSTRRGSCDERRRDRP